MNLTVILQLMKTFNKINVQIPTYSSLPIYLRSLDYFNSFSILTVLIAHASTFLCFMS